MLMTRTMAILLVLMLTACGGAAVRNQVETLDKSIEEYAYALRWQRKNDAVSYHMSRDGTRPHIDASAMDVIRVTDFTIREKTLNADLTGATVVGDLNYYHSEYGTLKTIEYHQSWWYDEKSKKWFVESEFPQFK